MDGDMYRIYTIDSKGMLNCIDGISYGSEDVAISAMCRYDKDNLYAVWGETLTILKVYEC